MFSAKIACLVGIFYAGHCFFDVTGKEKRISYDKNTSAVLKANNVKEIRVFTGDVTEKLTHLYSVDKEGEIFRHVNYDHFSQKSGPMIEEFYSKDFSNTYIRGRKTINGELSVYEKIISLYSSTGNLLQKETKEYLGNFIHTIEKYDTSFLAGIDMQKYIIHSETGDTIRMIRHLKSEDIEENIIWQKDSGKWKEEERSFTTFDADGKYIRYEFYRNGKLHSHYTRKEREMEMDTGFTYIENYNPLPVAEPRIDTVFSNSPDIVFPFQVIKQGKYMVLVKYGVNNHSPESVSVYESTGLFIKFIYVPNPVANERYEYSFR